MPKKHVYREGDIVRIVKPLVVTRVGYPFDLFKEAERIGLEHHADIAALLSKIMPEKAPIELDRGWHAYDRLTQRLAFIVGAYRGLGGSERQLWTEEQLDMVNHRWRVEAKRTVMTGTYYRPSSYTSYEGEYEYRPGGLDKMRGRQLLKLFRTDWLSSDGVEVEAANVEPELAKGAE